MKPKTHPISSAPAAIQNAFNHVRKHYPGVNRVCYDADTRWHFTGPDLKAPKFGSEIDVGILEDGQAQLNEFPVIYQLP